MKIRILIISLFLITTISNAQKSMTFNKAIKIEIFQKLDSIYPGGINTEIANSVFKDHKAYIEAYQKFIYQLSEYLSKNNFKWGKQVNCFNKIYFSEKGTVDYFLYNFKEGQLTRNQEKHFAKLLKKFIRDAKFGLPTNKKFAQCSPIKYNDI